MERRIYMLGTTLSIVIPVVLIAYGVWLAVRMIRNRSTGKCGSCGSCPYAGGCHSAENCRLEQEQREAKKDA
ncbi:MAG: FeoB-associated Cys-rich membrane protein [Clostridia bacterium]|nr:FeoB-associated Cys-rich membrane protein [Clostridia bacterium]